MVQGDGNKKNSPMIRSAGLGQEPKDRAAAENKQDKTPDDGKNKPHSGLLTPRTPLPGQTMTRGKRQGPGHKKAGPTPGPAKVIRGVMSAEARPSRPGRTAPAVKATLVDTSALIKLHYGIPRQVLQAFF